MPQGPPSRDTPPSCQAAVMRSCHDSLRIVIYITLVLPESMSLRAVRGFYDTEPKREEKKDTERKTDN